jgi:hypothetical protein
MYLHNSTVTPYITKLQWRGGGGKRVLEDKEGTLYCGTRAVGGDHVLVRVLREITARDLVALSTFVGRESASKKEIARSEIDI